MDVPGGPGVTGSVKAGAGISITADGTVSVDSATNTTKIVAGSNISISPPSGVGVVTISGSAVPDPPIPSGAKMIFMMASAPTGWVQSTGFEGRALRLTDGQGGGTGGSVSFTSAFTSQSVTGSVSLSGLSVSGQTNDANVTSSGNISLGGLSASPATVSEGQFGSHNHQLYSCTYASQTKCQANGNTQVGAGNIDTNAKGGNGSHSHSVSGSANFNGGSSSHSHGFSSGVSGSAGFSGNPINLAVSYADGIICTKT